MWLFGRLTAASPALLHLSWLSTGLYLPMPSAWSAASSARSRSTAVQSGNLRVGWHFVRSFRQGFVTSSCAFFSKHPEYAKHHCTPTHSVFGHAAALREQSRNGRLAGFLWLFARLSWLLPPSYYSLGFARLPHCALDRRSTITPPSIHATPVTSPSTHKGATHRNIRSAVFDKSRCFGGFAFGGGPSHTAILLPVAMRPPHSRRSPLALLQHPFPSLAVVRRAPPQSMRESRRSEGQPRARRRQRGCSPGRSALETSQWRPPLTAAAASQAGHASCCASRAIA